MNCNQGAESVICFLMALSSLNKYADRAYGALFQQVVSEEVLPKRKSLLSTNQAE
jgi:hypothetical protein